MDLRKWYIEHLIWPAMERLRGNSIRRYGREMAESQYQDPKPLQLQKLQTLLQHCRDNCPCYADLDLTGLEADPIACLRQVKPLQKRDFQADPDSHTAKNASGLIENTTGGSTGTPLHFYMTRPQVEHYEAARWRGLGWYGITQGSRCAMVWGNPIELDANAQKKNARRELWLKNRKIFSAYTLGADRMPGLLRELRKFRPEYIYGYASALDTMAKLMLDGNLTPGIPLKAVVTTAETQHPEAAERIAKAFGCPVVNEYGARDAGILAYTCPCGSLHISAENALLEVLDPVTLEPLPDGQEGVLAITDLNAAAQPRLRYLLGDVAVFSDKPCTCGRKLPVLERVAGREDALLLAADGHLIHGHAIYHFAGVPSVRRFKFEQTAPCEGTLYLEGELPEERLRGLEQLLGFPIRVEQVEEILPEPSGKFRYAVRRFPLPEK